MGMKSLLLATTLLSSAAAAQTPTNFVPATPTTPSPIKSRDINAAFGSKCDVNVSACTVFPTGASVGSSVAVRLTQAGLIVEDLGAVGLGASTCTANSADQTAFITALSKTSYVSVSPSPIGSASPKTYCVANLVLGNNQILDLRGAKLRPMPGAQWLVKTTGFKSQVLNGQLEDPDGFTLRSTTLSASTTLGGTTITVANASQMAVGQVISVQLNSGLHHISLITAINGNIITMLDPLPISATAMTIVAGGSGYQSTDIVSAPVVNGAPATAAVTVSAGAITAASLLVPGLYLTDPTSGGPIGVQGGSGSGATVSMTLSGAASGAPVQAAFGLLLADQWQYGLWDAVNFVNAPVAFQLLGTGLTASNNTTQNMVTRITASGAILAGMAAGVGVSQTTYEHVFLYGQYPQGGGVGVYQAGTTSLPVASGGNQYIDAQALQFERGAALNNAQYSQFIGTVWDSLSAYGLDVNGGDTLSFGGTTYAGYTGPSAYSPTSIAAQGVGAVFRGAAQNVSLTGLTTKLNSCDLSIDASATVQLNTPAWGPGRVACGTGIISAHGPSLSGSTTATVAANTTSYLGPNGAQTTQTSNSWVASSNWQLSQLYIRTDTLLGTGQTATASLVNNTGQNTPLSCAIPGTSYSCSITLPAGVKVTLGDNLSIKLITSSGAAAARYNYFVNYIP